MTEEGYETSSSVYFSLEDGNLDTINNRIVLKAGNINGIDGNPFLDPSTGFNDYIIFRFVYDQNDQFLGIDTLAYIPNSQRQAAYEQIKALWDTENWDAIYEIFQNAFTFIPCTGEEYKALKEAGLN